MLANILVEYEKAFDKMRFLSKPATFLVSISAFFSLYSLAEAYNSSEYAKNLFWTLIKEENLFVWIFFQFAIFIVFGARLIALFYNSKMALNYSICLWLIGIFLISTYFYLSLPSNEDFITKTLANSETIKYYKLEMYPAIFRQSSQSFSAVAFFYLLLSPIKESLTLIFAFIKSRQKVQNL